MCALYDNEMRGNTGPLLGSLSGRQEDKIEAIAQVKSVYNNGAINCMHTAQILFTVALASMGVILGIALQVARRIFRHKKISDGNRFVARDREHPGKKAKARRSVPQHSAEDLQFSGKQRRENVSASFAPYGVLLQGVFLGVGIALLLQALRATQQKDSDPG